MKPAGLNGVVSAGRPAGTTGRWQRLWSAGLLALALAATGCRTYYEQSASFRSAWVQGDFERAARLGLANAEKYDGTKDGVVWHLEAGAALRPLGRYGESNGQLAAAAEQIEHYEQQARVRLSVELGATFSNQQNRPYEGRACDKIMLHTYRALNYLALGEIDKARPELIRAYQRQQEAVEANARRIEAALQAERRSDQRELIAAARRDPGLQAQLSRITAPLERFHVYADYVNPFTVYLDGLYFWHAGLDASDLERARKSISRVREVAGDNPAVQADWEDLQAGRLDPGPLTYVILETGRAPGLVQERIDIPILVADVSYVGAAFPRLEFYDDHLRQLTVKGGGREVVTRQVASMDAVVATEFRNEWPAILTRTLVSTITKAAAGYLANQAARQQSDSLGLLARMVTAAVQAAINIADTRCWSTLPKEFQLARLPTPPDRLLWLETPDGRRQRVELVPGRVNVVYVRAVTSYGPVVTGQFILR